VDRWANSQTDMRELTVAFHNFVHTPKKRSLIILTIKNQNFVPPISENLEVINNSK